MIILRNKEFAEKLPLKYRFERFNAFDKKDIDIVADKSRSDDEREKALKRLKNIQYASKVGIAGIAGKIGYDLLRKDLGTSKTVAATMPIVQGAAAVGGIRGVHKHWHKDHPYFERISDEGKVKRGEMSVDKFLNKWRGVKGVSNIQKKFDRD
jgi:hypothetical protein